MKTHSTLPLLALTVLGLTGLASSPAATPRRAVAAQGTETCCQASGASLRTLFVQSEDASKPTGLVRGRVLFDGETPVAQELSITEAQSVGCTSDGSRVCAANVTLLVGKHKGLANALVTISVPDQTLVIPPKPVPLDQVQCRFGQHVIVVPVGTTLEYRNSDSVSHNIHTYSPRNKAFNRTLAAGASYKQAVKQAEIIQIRCDMHPWMRAYVAAVDTNYAALTDATGAFEIKGLAPGQYTAKVWHETLGKTTVQVLVDASGQSAAISVALKPKKSKRRR